MEEHKKPAESNSLPNAEDLFQPDYNVKIHNILGFDPSINQYIVDLQLNQHRD
jgi:hypothetical protein